MMFERFQQIFNGFQWMFKCFSTHFNVRLALNLTAQCLHNYGCGLILFGHYPPVCRMDLSCSLPIAYCSLPMARPGGMRGAIESAALAAWQALACQIQSTSPKLQISNLQISNPPQISPQRPRAFRPADQKSSPLPLAIFIPLGTRRAKCKITVNDGS